MPPLRLAPLDEPVQHVGFAGERVREVVDALAEVVDPQHKGGHVVVARDVDLVLDCFGFTRDALDFGLEAVDYVVPALR